MAGSNRDADEAADAVGGHDLPRDGQQVRGLGDLVEAADAAGQRHAADEPVAQGQDLVHLAEPIGEAALSPEEQRLPIGGEEMQASDLVAGDMGQRVDGLLEDLVEVEGPAHRRRHRPQDLEVAHGRRSAGRAARGHPGHCYTILIIVSTAQGRKL